MNILGIVPHFHFIFYYVVIFLLWLNNTLQKIVYISPTAMSAYYSRSKDQNSNSLSEIALIKSASSRSIADKGRYGDDGKSPDAYIPQRTNPSTILEQPGTFAFIFTTSVFVKCL